MIQLKDISRRNIRMDVKYITATAEQLPTVPIVDGQIIAISNSDAFFYDMGSTRRPVSGQKMVESLPESTDGIYPNTLFYVTSGDNKGIVWWTGTEFIVVANQNTDQNVLSQSTETKQFYLSGSLDASDSTSSLVKRSDVYVDAQGNIHAPGYKGGKADESWSADNAANAEKATNDGIGNEIAETYISDIRQDGDKLILTFGNGNTKEVNITDNDTHYTTGLVFSDTSSGKENAVGENGSVYMNILDDQTLRSSHLINGSGIAEVTSDAEGNLDIHVTDKWKPNTKDEPGYVAAGEPSKIWGTDAQGEPGWIDGYSHPESEVDPGTYRSVTVDKLGHVISGTNPTTLEGYEITDGVKYKKLETLVNLNALVDPGFYVADSGNTITNKPEGVDSFALVVCPSDASGFYIQKLFSSGKNSNSRQYTRRCIDGSYGPWTVDELTDTVYTHPNDSGFRHIPSGGSEGYILSWEDDGDAQWADPTQAIPEFSSATESEAGKPGLVPAPTPQDSNRFLKSDGTWAPVSGVGSIQWKEFPSN